MTGRKRVLKEELRIFEALTRLAYPGGSKWSENADAAKSIPLQKVEFIHFKIRINSYSINFLFIQRTWVAVEFIYCFTLYFYSATYPSLPRVLILKTSG